MTKFLLLALGLLLAYWIIKGYNRKIRSGPKQPPAASGEDMVRCAQCGVYLPRSESLMTGRAFYCSADHRRLHEKTD